MSGADDPALGSWWTVALAREAGLDGDPTSSGEWAWGIGRFGRDAQVRFCLAAAEIALERWRQYRPFEGQRDYAAEEGPAQALRLAECWLSGDADVVAAEAPSCLATLRSLEEHMWLAAEEDGTSEDSPTSIEQMAHASAVFLALAEATAWTPEHARATALSGEEEETVLAGPAMECVRALEGLAGIFGAGFVDVRHRLWRQMHP